MDPSAGYLLSALPLFRTAVSLNYSWSLLHRISNGKDQRLTVSATVYGIKTAVQ